MKVYIQGVAEPDVLEGGATGIFLSRNYSEARLENIAAVGGALRELGIEASRAKSRREVTVHADW